MMTGSWSLDAASPIGKTAADCAIVLGAIAGHDPRDATTSRRDIPDYLSETAGGVRGLRVGVVRELAPGKESDPDIASAFASAIAVLRKLGAEVQEVSIPLIALSAPVFVAICDTDAAHLHHQTLRTNPAVYDAATRTRLLSAALLSADIYSTALRARGALRQQMLAALAQVDVLVTPTASGPPSLIDEYGRPFSSMENVIARQFGSRSFSTAFSLAALPALSAPCGFSAIGTPIGLQIGGRPFQEGTVLRAAAAFGRETEWTGRRVKIEE
jgi:aspartyl-tRNA(Asn)/glutamyl-tRNA(Gln) amidotransferase subunit A